MGENIQMMISSLHQLTVFALCTAGGAACAALYTFLSALRRSLRDGRGITVAADAAFTLALLGAIIASALRFNNGAIRLYQLLGAALGFLLHCLCFYPITMKISLFVLKLIFLLLAPVRFLWRGARMYIKEIFDKAKNFKEKIVKTIRRIFSLRKRHKKMRKNYKKML